MILAYGWSVASWLALVAPQIPDLPDAPIQSAEPPAESGEPSEPSEPPSDGAASEGEPAAADEPAQPEPDADADAAPSEATEGSESSAPESPPAAEDAPAADPFEGTQTSSAAPGDDERAPLDVEDEPTTPEFDRRGLLIVLGTGLTHCPQAFCTAIPMGGVGRFELGYRLGRWAFVSTVVGGGGLVPDDEKDNTIIRSIRTLDVATGAQFFPVREGRFDPFLGATLGWARTSRRYEPESPTKQQYGSRGALRLSAGFAWYLRRRIAVGPRIDGQLPFAGKWCTGFDDGDEQCSSIRGEILDDLEDPMEKRQQRRAFPRMWTFTVDLRINM